MGRFPVAGIAAATAVTVLMAACGDDSRQSASIDGTTAPTDGTTAPTDGSTATTDGTTATGTSVATGNDATEPVENDTAVIDLGDDGTYAPEIDPSQFVDTIDHPYLPLLPGTQWEYEGTNEDGEIEVIEIEVLEETRTVMGVSTTVVHDVESIDGEIIEDTYDWFAQDGDGNVWYFGEDTTSYEDGEPDTAGAWEAGVDGALPGIAMPADPSVTGVGYRQEFYEGEAEDMGEIIATSGSVSTPYEDFDDVIVTRDWTPLEPDVVEEKTYARGVGFVHETKTAGEEGTVELVNFTPGGG